MYFIFPLVVAALARAAITAPAQPEYANIMARASIGRFEGKFSFFAVQDAFPKA